MRELVSIYRVESALGRHLPSNPRVYMHLPLHLSMLVHTHVHTSYMLRTYIHNMYTMYIQTWKTVITLKEEHSLFLVTRQAMHLRWPSGLVAVALELLGPGSPIWSISWRFFCCQHLWHRILLVKSHWHHPGSSLISLFAVHPGPRISYASIHILKRIPKIHRQYHSQPEEGCVSNCLWHTF